MFHTKYNAMKMLQGDPLSIVAILMYDNVYLNLSKSLAD